MTALLLHGYASGIYSSRRIEKAARERADFMMIVAGDVPDFRTISDFRKRHLRALAKLFVQVLKLCEAAGLANLGHVAIDGTKIKANASKHKAMSYEHMKKREAELQAEVDRWRAAAEAADAEEDRRLHGARRGDEMPRWIADNEKWLAKFRAAKAEMEAEARAGRPKRRGVVAGNAQQHASRHRFRQLDIQVDVAALVDLRRDHALHCRCRFIIGDAQRLRSNEQVDGVADPGALQRSGRHRHPRRAERDRGNRSVDPFEAGTQHIGAPVYPTSTNNPPTCRSNRRR